MWAVWKLCLKVTRCYFAKGINILLIAALLLLNQVLVAGRRRAVCWMHWNNTWRRSRERNQSLSKPISPRRPDFLPPYFMKFHCFLLQITPLLVLCVGCFVKCQFFSLFQWIWPLKPNVVVCVICFCFGERMLWRCGVPDTVRRSSALRGRSSVPTLKCRVAVQQQGSCWVALVHALTVNFHV